MISHKFDVGERVRLVIDKYSGDVPPGIYTISRRLPVEANICRYRVRHSQDGHERVVQESQMVSGAAA